MKKKEYMKPEMHICEMGVMQILASSETLHVGNTSEDDEDVPTSSDGSIWGD